MIQLKKKRGRPCKGRGPKSHFYNCRFTDEEYEKFLDIVEYYGISRGDYIRNMIMEEWHRIFIH